MSNSSKNISKHIVDSKNKKTLRISQGDLNLISCLLAFYVFLKLVHFYFILYNSLSCRLQFSMADRGGTAGER